MMTYLSQDDLSGIYLIKWPGCDVDGDDVTPEQAQEILVRTCNPDFFSNDKAFLNEIETIFYSAIPKPEWLKRWWAWKPDKPDFDAWQEYWEKKDSYLKEMRILDLHYLQNYRACSAFIGGPYGWCNWSGKIFQRGINIGKWPDASEVFDDWAAIAEAFPFLKLTCRLLTHEAGYSEGNPGIAVVYEVSNGEVKARLPEPGEERMSSSDDDRWPITYFERNLNLHDSFWERGVSPLIWRESCERVANSREVIFPQALEASQ